MSISSDFLYITQQHQNSPLLDTLQCCMFIY